MLLQYSKGELHTIYYGCIKKAVSVARKYAGVGKYELDIAKARRLASVNGAGAEKKAPASEVGS